MRNKQIENQPIPKILSLFPKDENFQDTREAARGAWISDNAWEKINSIFSLSQNDEAVQVAKEIKEENPGNVEGVFLTENHFAVIEKNVSSQLQKLSTKAAPKETNEKLEQKKIEPPKLPAKENNEKPKETLEQIKNEPSKLPTKDNNEKHKETLEQRLMKESPYLRLLAQRAKEKKSSEVKKN